MKSTNKTQMNFQRGVNYKVTPNAAKCSDAESGEATKVQENFNWTNEKFSEKPTPYPDTTKQMNFRNGQ